MSTLAPREIPRVKLAVTLAVLSAAPDLDVIGFRYGIAYGDVLGHRGFTHSIAFALIAGLITPSLVFRGVPSRSRSWWWIVSLAFCATASHGVLDAFTDAGLGVGFLIPLDNTRYFAPWRPLATSPLSISAFFDGPALRILGNEFVWVGLPLMGLFGVRRVLRRGRTRGSDGDG